MSQREWVMMGFRKRLGVLTGVTTKEMYGYMEDGAGRGEFGES